MSRCTQPSISSSIALGRLSSTKKSAGPPMPNDVREASGSSSLTPGREASHLALDAVRQLIAQLVDVSGAHQEQEVARPDQTLEHIASQLQITDVRSVLHLMRKVRCLDPGGVLRTCAVNVQHQHFVSSVERTREVVHESRQARVPVW